MKRKTTTGGKGRFDMAKIEATTEADIARHAREDGEEEWTEAMQRRVHMVDFGKKDIHIRVNRRVLAFFQRGGRGYQSRINAALEAFVDAHERKAG